MKIAISIGDLNGIGFEIALNSHEKIKKLCDPLYIVDRSMALQASKLLNKKLPKDFKTIPLSLDYTISPSKISSQSGNYSFCSFEKACDLADAKEVDAIVTLPINKEAWSKASINFSGHTDYLAHRYKKDAIMMLGCQKMFVALYTHHIPLKDVPKQIDKDKLISFMDTLYSELKFEKVAVLGLNPHAGDGGVIGDEDKIIQEAINTINKRLNSDIFIGPLVPDIAFTPRVRNQFKYFIALYHDQGLIPLKALYFEDSINVSLNLPIIRTSVDHGTAFDIAYKDKNPSTTSYINSIKEALELAKKRNPQSSL